MEEFQCRLRSAASLRPVEQGDSSAYMHRAERVMRQISSGKASANESKYPYIVELTVTSDGLDVGLGRRIIDFHKARHIQPRHGRSTIPRGEREAHYRWCFSDLETARAFVEQFGGAFYKTTGA